MFVAVTEGEGSNRRQLSITRSSKIKQTLDPDWNEKLRLIRATKGSRITVTVCDYDTIGKPDFLGQVSIRLGAFHDKWEQEITRNLEPYALPVFTKGGGKQLPMDDTTTPPTGTITFKLHHLPVSSTMCGFVDRKKLAWHGASSRWVRVWAVLAAQQICLFDDPSETFTKGDGHRELIKIADLTKPPMLDEKDGSAILIKSHKKRS